MMLLVSGRKSMHVYVMFLLSVSKSFTKRPLSSANVDKNLVYITKPSHITHRIHAGYILSSADEKHVPSRES